MRLSRLAWCALSLGTAQAVLDYVIPYVNEREAFGEPISHRQSVAFMVANIGIELNGMRLVTYRAASRAAQGKSFAREVALARRLCAEKGMQIGNDGVQLLGGHGFVKEHPVERWYRDLRAIGLMEGRRPRLMINLETPKKFRPLIGNAHQVAMNLLRPNSRKYDTLEHEYPKELDMLAAMVDGLVRVRRGQRRRRVRRHAAAEDAPGRGRTAAPRTAPTSRPCSRSWRCAGATSACCCRCRGRGSATRRSPRSPTTSRPSGSRASGPAMAITEPGVGSDSANIQTTATLDGDDYVINGEKIYVTAGERCDHVVVWATLDKTLGRAAIKSFVVPKGTPGMTLERLEHKLGIRSSDTAAFRFENCRVPKENLLGDPDVDAKQGFAGAMATFDNTRPLVAAMAVGCARASLELTKELLEEAGVVIDYDRPAQTQSAAAATFLQLESDWEAAYLLDAAGGLDGRQRQAQLARGVDGQGQGRPRRQRRHAALRGAGRQRRLQRARPAGEVGPRLQDPGHLRGHPADPAADRRPPAAGQVEHRAEVAPSRRSPSRLR